MLTFEHDLDLSLSLLRCLTHIEVTQLYNQVRIWSKRQLMFLRQVEQKLKYRSTSSNGNCSNKGQFTSFFWRRKGWQTGFYPGQCPDWGRVRWSDQDNRGSGIWARSHQCRGRTPATLPWGQKQWEVHPWQCGESQHDLGKDQRLHSRCLEEQTYSCWPKWETEVPEVWPRRIFCSSPRRKIHQTRWERGELHNCSTLP